jgi:hypothetical protein
MFFDGNKEKDLGDLGYKPLNPGVYDVTLDEISINDNSQGTGQYVKAKFQVISGEAEGRYLFSNYNIVHQNELAQNIGKAQFKDLLKAVIGEPVLKSENDLYRLQGKMLQVEVGLQKRKDTGEMQNVIKRHFSKAKTQPKKQVGESEIPF